jgi:hypothetical protein
MIPAVFLRRFMQLNVRYASYCVLAHLFCFHKLFASLLNPDSDPEATVTYNPIPSSSSCASPLFYMSRCPLEVDLTLALDEFRSLPEGSWNGNWGGYAAVNFKGYFSPYSSVQLGGSYALYDWAGRAFAPFSDPDSLQQQGFLTIGASRQIYCSGVNVGIAYDWMLNKNFGLFAVDPCFDQIRGQLGYVIKHSNEIGVWAAYGIRISHQKSQEVPLQFRGISQVNLFWCHYFKNNGYGMLWAGTPYRRGLMYKSGCPGNFIFGVQFSMPVTKYLSVEGHGAYMVPRGTSGLTPAKNYASNISIGITYSFGKRREDKSPYMTLANNSNFIADTNQNF